MPKGKYTDADLATPATQGKYTDADLAPEPEQDFSAPKDNKEGTYKMAGPKGIVIPVPYSKVMDAYKAGYKIDPVDLRKYADDKTSELKGWRSSRIPELNLGKPTPTAELPEAYNVVEAAPEKWSKDWIKSKGLTAVRSGIDLLPTVGGVLGGAAAGGAASETGPGAIAAGAAGAGAGAGLGEDARQFLNEKLFGDPEMSAKESAEKIGAQAAAGAVSEGAGRIGGKILGPALAKFRNSAAQSKRVGITLLPSEAAGKAPSYLERLAKGNIFSAAQMEQFRTIQNTESRAAVQRIADSISKYRGSREGLGKLVQKGIEEHKAVFRNLQNQMYKDIESQVGEHESLVPVQKQVTKIVNGKPVNTVVTVNEKRMVDNVMPSTKPIKAFAQQELKKLDQVEKVLHPNLLRQSRSMLANILKAPDHITFSAMRNARSDILSKVRELDQALAGKEAGLAKKMADLFDDSIMDAVQKSKIPGLEQAVRDADAFTRQEHEMFEQALVKKIVDTKKPEAIATLIRGSNLDSLGNQEVRDLFRILPKNLHVPVQRQILIDTMRQSTNLNTKVFSERKFADMLARMGDERGKIVFGNNWKNIEELADIFAKINGPSGLEGGGSGAAFQNIGTVKNVLGLIGAVGGAAIGASAGARGAAEGAGIGALVGEGLSIAGSYVSFKSLAAALTHPETTAKLLTVLQGAIKYGAQAPIAVKNVVKGNQRLQDVRKEAIMRSPTKVRVDTVNGETKFFLNQQEADKWLKDHPEEQQAVPNAPAPPGGQSSAKPYTHVFNAETGIIEAA